MEAIGTTRTELSLSGLTKLRPLPHYLRFNEVRLFYNLGQNSMEEKCRSTHNYLSLLKEALKDSIAIRFYGKIVQDDHKDFDDHSKLLNYLSKQLLEMLNSSREYNFSISLNSDEAGANIVINSIIQMSQIYRCSTLRFDLWHTPQPVLLPVEAISYWLNRSIGNGMNFIGRVPQEIFLRIYAFSIQNVVEMCDHLVEVCFFVIKF